MTAAVVFDIDGTLSDATHRLHHVTGGNRDWDAFFAGMGDDPVVEPIRKLLFRLGNDSAIVLCTGRPEKYRDVTRDWLNQSGIAYAMLYMRPDGDHRPDHVVKAEMLVRMRVTGYDPWLAVDDRKSIIDMWKREHIMVLVVNGGSDF